MSASFKSEYVIIIIMSSVQCSVNAVLQTKRSMFWAPVSVPGGSAPGPRAIYVVEFVIVDFVVDF